MISVLGEQLESRFLQESETYSQRETQLFNYSGASQQGWAGLGWARDSLLSQKGEIIPGTLEQLEAPKGPSKSPQELVEEQRAPGVQQELPDIHNASQQCHQSTDWP